MAPWAPNSLRWAWRWAGRTVSLTQPDAVLSVHQSHAEAGADIQITNTLAMNRIYFEKHYLGVDVEAVNPDCG
jgi:methionine synthase I (cobalamin-dependent)